ncbi:hypothetical protein ZTR_03273 [Talaromyces verruculosus]|nr:hypothetical protein ZTR_03273 [Talaromyces verruculosus]
MLIRGVARLFFPIALLLVFVVAQLKRNLFPGSWSIGYGRWAKATAIPLILSPDPSKETHSKPGPDLDLSKHLDADDHDIYLDLEKVPLSDGNLVQSSGQQQQQEAAEILGQSQDSEKTAQEKPGNTHNTIFSLSTASGTYFNISFGDHETLNPNIIPHPSSSDKWIIVAQQKAGGDQEGRHPAVSIQLVCDASFRSSDGSEANDHESYSLSTSRSGSNSETLSCITPPTILPIEATSSGNRCQGRWSPLSLNIGPHDARLFYGPKVPYVIYGSNSQFTCFGQWIHDFRKLVNWLSSLSSSSLNEDPNSQSTQTEKNTEMFSSATELYRPPPYGQIEKNWFIFWDPPGDAYVHYDVWPQRSFAKIERIQGNKLLVDESSMVSLTVGPDLAFLASTSDMTCMDRYMPQVPDKSEGFIHQATNSLSITLCKRSEPDCQPTDMNTFIFTIFQKKAHLGFGASSYEPYVILFRRTAPFEIHSISTKPFWIHGRKPSLLERGTHEMIYITSMSWKSHVQKYHGYSDDVLFLAFGIDDSRTAGIDITASDLLKDMGFCMNT